MLAQRYLVQKGWFYGAGRLLVRIAILGIILLLGRRTIRYLGYAAQAITFPFGLDYGEGIVWQQALLIPGPRMYGDITQFPFIVFHYPPVYHLVIRAIAVFGIDPLAAGRGTTMAATIAIAVLVGAIVATAVQGMVSANARILGATVGGLMVFAYHPVQVWAVTMRVDMLAIGFSMAGICIAILAGQRTIILCAAIVMFLLAVYTKQTELSAPIAAMLVAIVVDARSAVKASAFGLLVGGAAFIILELSTGGGFWHHIFTYNINRFSFDELKRNLLDQEADALGVLVGVLAFAYLWWIEATAPRIEGWVEALRQSRRLRALTIMSMWFGLASTQLLSLGKSGAASNYFIEWMCITTVPIGMVAGLAWDRAGTRSKDVLFAGFAGLLLSLALAEHIRHGPLAEVRIVNEPNGIALRSHLVDLIRKTSKPALSEDMVLLLRAGQPVPIEPAIFTELTETGIWDQQSLLKLIQNHFFGVIILTHEEDKNLIRFTNEALKAIENSYPSVEHLGNDLIGKYIIHRPLQPKKLGATSTVR
jgi:hypothetical protein